MAAVPRPKDSTPGPFGNLGSQTPQLSPSAVPTSQSPDVDDDPMASGAPLERWLENNLDLANLQTLHDAFKGLDLDSSGLISETEFLHAFESVFDNSPSKEYLSKLFMKVDANSDGFIGWDEFSTFLLLGNVRKDRDVSMDIFKPEFRDPNDPSLHHKDMINHILVLAAQNKYITCSRDGTLKVWKTDTLELSATITVRHSVSNYTHLNKIDSSAPDPITIGGGWLRTACHLKNQRIVCAGVARRIYIVDLSTNEVVNSIKCGLAMANCLIVFQMDTMWGSLAVARQQLERPKAKGKRSGELPRSAGPQLVELGEKNIMLDNKELVDVLAYGDQHGCIHIISQVTRKELHQDKVHTDSITAIKYHADLFSLITASLDGRIVLYDLEGRKVTRVYKQHTKGVTAFVWVHTYLYIASCGLERDILLWSPYSLKQVGRLQGHLASVLDIVFDPVQGQLISISTDKTICVWDARTQDLLSKVHEMRRFRPDNLITAVAMNPSNNHFVFGTTRLHVRPIRNHTQLQESGRCHKSAVVGLLYARVFNQIVSVEQAGWAMVWEASSGRAVVQFPVCDSRRQVTAVNFDHSGRRLVLGFDTGRVTMHNFNNGYRLHDLVTGADTSVRATSEITAITSLLRSDQARAYIVAGGWNRVVWMWPNAPTSYRQPAVVVLSAINIQDILSLSFCDPNIITSSTSDGKVVLWNVDSGHVRTILDCNPPTPAANPPPDTGKRRASASSRGQAAAGASELWNCQENAVEKVLVLKEKRPLVVSTGTDGVLRVWNAFTGTLATSVSAGHRPDTPVASLDTDETNSFLFTGDVHGWLRVWDCSQLEPNMVSPSRATPNPSPNVLMPLWTWRAHKSGVHAVVHLSKYDLIASAGSDMQVHLWSLHGVKLANLGTRQWTAQDILAAKSPDCGPDVVCGKMQWDGPGPIEPWHWAGAEEDDRSTCNSPKAQERSPPPSAPTWRLQGILNRDPAPPATAPAPAPLPQPPATAPVRASTVGASRATTTEARRAGTGARVVVPKLPLVGVADGGKKAPETKSDLLAWLAREEEEEEEEEAKRPTTVAVGVRDTVRVEQASQRPSSSAGTSKHNNTNGVVGLHCTPQLLDDVLARRPWWPGWETRRQLRTYEHKRTPKYPSVAPYMAGHLPTYKLAPESQFARVDMTHISTKAVAAAPKANKGRPYRGSPRAATARGGGSGSGGDGGSLGGATTARGMLEGNEWADESSKPIPSVPPGSARGISRRPTAPSTPNSARTYSVGAPTPRTRRPATRR